MCTLETEGSSWHQWLEDRKLLLTVNYENTPSHGVPWLQLSCFWWTVKTTSLPSCKLRTWSYQQLGRAHNAYICSQANMQARVSTSLLSFHRILARSAAPSFSPNHLEAYHSFHWFMGLERYLSAQYSGKHSSGTLKWSVSCFVETWPLQDSTIK